MALYLKKLLPNVLVELLKQSQTLQLGEKANVGFKDYDEAFEYQTSSGWKSDGGVNLNLEDSYTDKCPQCLERE